MSAPPLEVAHRWAVDRPRKFSPELVNETYAKARNAAGQLEEFVRSRQPSNRVSFEEVVNGEELLEECRRLGYTATGPPKNPVK
jgi:hypothetical protein